MGACSCAREDLTTDSKSIILFIIYVEISLNLFKKLYPIGKGGFGRVWKVQPRNRTIASPVNIYYALKEMSKVKIYMKKSIQSIIHERRYLELLNYPFLINMHYAFETEDSLYIVMDFLSGGDLRYHLCKRIRFSEKEVKFIIANILLALKYVHKNHIIHRDLKPENLVFDSKGYLHLTDFGIAHEYQPGDEIIDSSGTPGYMSPEVILKHPHNCSVDFFSLGVITYELMMGKRPYNGKSRKELKEQILAKEVKLKQKQLPKQWNDLNVIDFVNRLLKRKAEERLGYKGVEEVMNHPWLNDVDWTHIEAMTEQSPFSFDSQDNFDEYYANKKDEEEYAKEKEYYLNVVNKNRYFRYYYYDINEAKKDSSARSKNSSTISTTYSNRKNTVLKKIPINSIAKAKNMNSINKDINSTRDISPFLPMMRETKDKDLSSIEPMSMKISRRNSKVINKN